MRLDAPGNQETVHLRLKFFLSAGDLTSSTPDTASKWYPRRSHCVRPARLDHQTYFKAIRVEPGRLEAVVLGRIPGAWPDEVALTPGRLPAGLGPFASRPHQRSWGGHERVDPAQEAGARATRLANLTTTLADAYAGRGIGQGAQLRGRTQGLALVTAPGLQPARAPPAPRPGAAWAGP